LGETFKLFLFSGGANLSNQNSVNDMIMRPTIERVVTLNDLVESVPEEIYRQIQSESESQDQHHHESTNMARSKDVSKSQRIRDYLDSHPHAKGPEIIEALSAYGIKQTDVGNVKSKMKKEGASSKKAVPASASRPSSPSPAAFGISIAALEAGTKFLKEAGSLNNAKELLTIIDQISAALKS
jgi:hypothetical protein